MRARSHSPSYSSTPQRCGPAPRSRAVFWIAGSDGAGARLTLEAHEPRTEPSAAAFGETDGRFGNCRAIRQDDVPSRRWAPHGAPPRARARRGPRHRGDPGKVGRLVEEREWWSSGRFGFTHRGPDRVEVGVVDRHPLRSTTGHRGEHSASPASARICSAAHNRGRRRAPGSSPQRSVCAGSSERCSGGTPRTARGEAVVERGGGGRERAGDDEVDIAALAVHVLQPPTALRWLTWGSGSSTRLLRWPP